MFACEYILIKPTRREITLVRLGLAYDVNLIFKARVLSRCYGNAYAELTVAILEYEKIVTPTTIAR